MRVLTEEETAVQNKYQRICLKTKLLNAKILLKILSESLQLIARHVYDIRGNSCFLLTCLFVRYENRNILGMHTTVFIGPVPESLKEINLSSLIPNQKINREIYFLIKKQ